MFNILLLRLLLLLDALDPRFAISRRNVIIPTC